MTSAKVTPSFFELTEEAIQKMIEAEERSSENRFDRIASPDAVTSITVATKSLLSRTGLQVAVARKASEIPKRLQDEQFKYSHPGSEGSLQATAERLQTGETLIVVLVWEVDVLVGYGIAAQKKACAEIEIIDVDRNSRRSASVCGTLQLSGGTFQVGVGHVVVQRLMDEVPRPIMVDATNDSSRYIFKSLGFQHDSRAKNPCILRLE